MPAPLNTYDPASHVCTWNGILISGYADGTFLKAERNEDAYMLKVGATGEGARVRNLNRSGIVTVTLLQTAACNDLLNAAHLLDEQGASNYGPLMIKNTLSGISVCMAEAAWIKKVAAPEFAKEVSNREWAFECHELTIL